GPGRPCSTEAGWVPEGAWVMEGGGGGSVRSFRRGRTPRKGAAMASPAVSRDQVLRFRARRHLLHREPDSAAPTDVHLLDYGVQDTGTDGAGWALAVRGASPAGPDDLVYAW